MGAFAFYFLSCTSSKENFSSTSAHDYTNNCYADSFLKYNPIPPTKAVAYINEFKKHKYKGLRRNRLLNAWSAFDVNALKDLVKNENTDSVFCYLAAYLKNERDKNKRRNPFVIIEVKPKPSFVCQHKRIASSLYFLPIKICPPPNTGCRFPGG